MLLAEINGKRCVEAEGSEDMLTSAVFGHLRLIQPQIFWDELFARAIDLNGVSLRTKLQNIGSACSTFQSLHIGFWQRLDSLEPDLMLFFEDGTHKMLVTIEVKLNSSMSNTEERDQLAAYAMILGKRNEVGLDSFRPIIYLTPHSSLTEIRRSTDTYRRKTRNGASADLYSLEWQDVAEVAQSFAGQSVPDLLSEVAEFLSRRGLIRFRGFHSPDSNVCGRFYRRRYFNSQTRTVVGNLGGRFYAN